MPNPWPKLNYDEWKKTSDSLHLWLQIVGKYRLAAVPWVNHSWHATFYVTPHGLTTGIIHTPRGAVEWTFDLLRHVLRGVSTERRRVVEMPLHSMSVAEFHTRFVELCADIGIPVDFHHAPNERPDPVPFSEDTAVRPYLVGEIEAFHGALICADRVFRRFRTGFLGKVSPVHLFWGSLDLAVTRFSGRDAPAHPGGIPALPDDVTREAYSHEVSSAGFWAGGGGLDEAAFYSYAYPGAEGFSTAEVSPEAAYYHEALGEFVLPYEQVRRAADPDAALLAFLESTWRAAASTADWPSELECSMGEPGVVRPL